MGIRFRRSIRIGPGVKVNLTKTGAGLTFGPKGAHYSIHSSGRRTKTVGLPGTGLYYQETSSGSPHNPPDGPTVAPVASKSGGCSRTGCGLLIVGVLVLGGIANILGGGAASTSPGAGSSSVPGLPVEGAGQSVAPGQSAAAAESVAPAASNPPATPKPVASPKPKSTPKPTATPRPTATPKPSPKPVALTVRIVASPGTVSPGSYASVSAATSAGATCSIEVDYASGPSKAAGLVMKTVPSSGTVSWTWKVGTRTTAGTWPVYITCQRGSSSASAQTSVRVT